MAEKVPLKILIVGKDAEKILASAFVKDLIEEGDSVSIGDVDADMVIGTTAVRTYENTTHFLKVLVKKVRAEKGTATPATDKPKKAKKKTKKQLAEEAAEPVEIFTPAEEAALEALMKVPDEQA